MGALIPGHLQQTALHTELERAGLVRIHQGKVRDTYRLPQPATLGLVATDRLSIFDFVLPVTVPQKGEILTALSVFWFRDVFPRTGIYNHLIAAGADMDYFLPASLRGNLELRRRMLVVRELHIVPVECIVRGYLTGSGWRSYQQTGRMHGIRIPEGLHDGAPLPQPIFDPTTKAEAGHDEPLDAASVTRQYGSWLEHYSHDCYRLLASVALERGNFILADTKLEFGQDRNLADEVATPDSSRYWDGDEWQRAREKRLCPAAYDKEYVRQWGMRVPIPAGAGRPSVGLHHLDPQIPEDVQFVHQLNVPTSIVDITRERYLEVCRRLTNLTLQQFQEKRLKA